MITFRPTLEFRQGTLKDLLIRSYEELLKSDPEHWEKEKKKWVAFDAEVYGNPDTVGRCVSVTSWDGKPAGFVSYDPRQKPLALIGHNCVVPEYRRKGIGMAQINAILQILKKQDFSRVEAVTGEHPFFAPAKKMYLKCGFAEKDITPGGPNPDFGLIRFEKTLVESA